VRRDRKAQSTKRRRSASELVERIINAATLLFSSKAYGEVSIREIANSANAVLPTLYRLFDDKRDIYVQCCVHATNAHAMKLSQVLKSDSREEVALFKMVRLSAELNMNKSAELRLLARVMRDGDEAIINQISRIFMTFATYRETVEIFAIVSNGDEPELRMLLLNRVFAELASMFSRWSELAKKPGDIDSFVLRVLQILLPAIDWNAIAKEEKQTRQGRGRKEQVGNRRD